MSWTFNSVRIFTQVFNDDDKQVISRLIPLNSKTVYHTFGYESTITKLKGIIVGNTDKNALKALVKTGVSYALVGPYDITGNFYLNNLSIELLSSICQSLRLDLDSDSPVYSVELELYLDEA